MKKNPNKFNQGENLRSKKHVNLKNFTKDPNLSHKITNPLSDQSTNDQIKSTPQTQQIVTKAKKETYSVKPKKKIKPDSADF